MEYTGAQHFEQSFCQITLHVRTLPPPLPLCVSAKAAAELDLAAVIDPQLAVTTATTAARIFRLQLCRRSASVSLHRECEVSGAISGDARSSRSANL